MSTRYQLTHLIPKDISLDQPTISRFSVIASGQVPPSRYSFCAVVSSSPDNSSFQITVYGGSEGYNTASPNFNLYVLSVPSFIWWGEIANLDDLDVSLGFATNR